jgi:hypothetical protein
LVSIQIYKLDGLFMPMAAELNNWLVFGIVLALLALATYGGSGQPAQTTPYPAPGFEGVPEMIVAESPNTQEFELDADQRGFYLDGQGIDTLSVAGGATVTLSIHVSPSIGYYGLIFRSSRFPDLKLNAGETGVVEFDGVGDFTITSYKPATTTFKAESQVAELLVRAS